MPDINLTQAEADALIAIEKVCINNDIHRYPMVGGAVAIPLVSIDKRENLLLDVSRGRIDFLKGKYQEACPASCCARETRFRWSVTSESG